MTSQTENLARDLLHHHFPFLHAVYNSRPDWLRNPKTGRALELDIFYPQINVAVEVQGVQHGRPVLGLQKDHADFMAQQARDMIKAEVCTSRGIELITVTSFDLTEARFPTIVRRILTIATRVTYADPILADKVRQARLRFERGEDTALLRPLYHQAERLSRMRFTPRKARVSWWRRLCSHLW